MGVGFFVVLPTIFNVSNGVGMVVTQPRDSDIESFLHVNERVFRLSIRDETIRQPVVNVREQRMVFAVKRREYFPRLDQIIISALVISLSI